MTNGFDEQKFAALLDLAGQDTAMELTQLLDADLTNLDMAMKATVDPVALHAQSHILLSIAGTIGATRVFDLAKHLNTMTKIADPVGLSAVLADMRIALNDLILRIRLTRASQGNAR